MGRRAGERELCKRDAERQSLRCVCTGDSTKRETATETERQSERQRHRDRQRQRQRGRETDAADSYAHTEKGERLTVHGVPLVDIFAWRQQHHPLEIDARVERRSGLLVQFVSERAFFEVLLGTEGLSQEESEGNERD